MALPRTSLFPRKCCNATVDQPRERRFYARTALFRKLIAAHQGRVSPRLLQPPLTNGRATSTSTLFMCANNCQRRTIFGGLKCSRFYGGNCFQGEKALKISLASQLFTSFALAVFFTEYWEGILKVFGIFFWFIFYFVYFRGFYIVNFWRFLYGRFL